RDMDKIVSKVSADQKSLITDGIKIREDLGKLILLPGKDYSEEVRHFFMENTPDHRILSLAYNLKYKENWKNVIIVSKDINLRMKARTLGIPADDYKSGTIKNIDELYTGKRICEDIDGELFNEICDASYGIDIEKFFINEQEICPNEYFILKSGNGSILVRFDPLSRKIVKLNKHVAYGIKPRNAEQTFALDALLDNNIPIVTLSGKAGTGKTLLALASAIERKSDYNQIYVARPIIPLGNKDLGYLPGDVKSKIDPYMQPLWDNLKIIKNQFPESDHNFIKLTDMIDQKKLLIEPLAYIRGRSLEKIFFIIDEAQNLTPHEIKTIITRVGDKTKIVFTGDPYQIDTPYLDSKSNGLSYLIDKFKGQKLYAHVTLEKGERSELAELATNLL
ncbi:MAG TPA: PhoH family protein, partial [Spirochaetota bacterium]|nr:PhoH family protein [Spirochaetota bacterium]